MKIFSTASILILCISCDFTQKQQSSQSTNSQSSVKMWAVDQCNTSVTGGNTWGVGSNGVNNYNSTYTSVSCTPTLITWAISVADNNYPNHVCLYGRTLKGNQTETDLKITSPIEMIKLSDKLLSPKSFSSVKVINYFKKEEAEAKDNKLPLMAKSTLIGTGLGMVFGFFTAVGEGIPVKAGTAIGAGMGAVFGLVTGGVMALSNEYSSTQNKNKAELELEKRPSNITSRMTLDSKVMAYTLSVAKNNTDGKECPELEEAKSIFIKHHNF